MGTHDINGSNTSSCIVGLGVSELFTTSVLTSSSPIGERWNGCRSHSFSQQHTLTACEYQHGECFLANLLTCAVKNVRVNVGFTLTMRIHLMSDRPNPQIAPYRPAMVLVRQKDKQKPIQLNRKATADTHTQWASKNHTQRAQIWANTDTQAHTHWRRPA